jgi:hypothetical protein
MKSLSRRKVDDEGGRKPAKVGPGLQVDGPRAWVWHLSVAGAEERGQAQAGRQRGQRREPGWAEDGDLGRARASICDDPGPRSSRAGGCGRHRAGRRPRRAARGAGPRLEAAPSALLTAARSVSAILRAEWGIWSLHLKSTTAASKVTSAGCSGASTDSMFESARNPRAKRLDPLPIIGREVKMVRRRRGRRSSATAYRAQR